MWVLALEMMAAVPWLYRHKQIWFQPLIAEPVMRPLDGTNRTALGAFGLEIGGEGRERRTAPDHHHRPVTRHQRRREFRQSAQTSRTDIREMLPCHPELTHINFEWPHQCRHGYAGFVYGTTVIGKAA